MQIGGILHAGGEQALAVLSLALAVQLLPPLGEEPEAGLIASQQLHLLAVFIQGMAGSSVLPGRVVHSGDGQLLHGLGCAVHQRLDIDTGHRDGQQTHGGKHGIPSAHIIRYHKLLIALAVGQALQRTPGLIGSGIYPLSGALLAVLLLQHGLENAEGHGRLRGGARLGNHIDGEIPIPDEGDGLQQGVGRQSVAGKKDVRGILLLQIVVGGCQQLHHSPGTQIGTADSDYHQHLRLLLDALGRCLNTGKFLLIIVSGQIDPARIVAAGPVMGSQHLSRLLQVCLPAVNVVLGNKSRNLGQIQFQHRKPS